MSIVRHEIITRFLLIAVLLSSAAYSQDRASWQIEVVEKVSEGAAAFTSLVVDRVGTLHLTYATRNGSDLRYAFRPKHAKRWDTVTVDKNGGAFNSLAIDAHGWPHVVYNSASVVGLHYATWDGKQWQKFVIDPVKTGHQTSMCLDSQGHPRVSYYREEYSNKRIARNLEYAYFDGTNWYIQTVDYRSGSGRWNAIALDRGEHPYISYSIGTVGYLGLANQGNSGWEHTLAALQESTGKADSYGASSLVLDTHDEPHLAYIDMSARTVNYSWREATGWKTEAVDYLSSTGSDRERINLQMDTNGRPHVVYFDPGLAILKYASRSDKGWSMETVDSDDAGEFASLRLDENNQPYISYTALAGNQLRIAHRLSPAPDTKK